MTPEFERIMIMQFKEMNNTLSGIALYLSRLSHDTSIIQDEKDIGIAAILADIKDQLVINKKEIKKEGK